LGGGIPLSLFGYSPSAIDTASGKEDLSRSARLFMVEEISFHYVRIPLGKFRTTQPYFLALRCMIELLLELNERPDSIELSNGFRHKTENQKFGFDSR
jgi:hypothetical protein